MTAYFQRFLPALFAALLLAAPAMALALEYKTSPAPNWVQPTALPNASATPSGDTAHRLFEKQVRVHAAGKTSFTRIASEALTTSGVQQLADIRINFDPSYQTLTMHAINVIRAGKTIKRLGNTPIKVLQRETELDAQVYDGSKTASVLLSDVRVGDIVEYAYSLDGSNPVFKNKVAGGSPLQWSVPVERVFVRLLAPSARAIAIKAHNAAPAPQVREENGYRDTQWSIDQQPGLRNDKDTPGWYDPYASVAWSEFPDWNAVVQWALPLYRVPARHSAPLQAEIDRIAKADADPARRAAAVLRMVQRDIRYLGIEVGPGSHAPSAPSLVYERRFGDCKDKALLTIAILRAMGIDARPALVHTELGKGIGQLAPSPHAFNHVIVQLLLDGKTYWLDPTRTMQKGDLAHLHQSDFGMALVLADGSRELAPMASARMSSTTVNSVFDSTAGLDKPVRYTVATTYQGGAAESTRRWIASQSLDETQKQYLNYYTRRYASIGVAAALKVADDADKNQLTVTETYDIAHFWPLSKDKKQQVANIRSDAVRDVLDGPAAVHRSSPLQVEFPREIIETVEVKLPEPWNIQTSKDTVKDSAFEFAHQVSKRKDGPGVILASRYRALADSVPADAMARHAANLKTAREALGYELTSDVEAGAAAFTASMPAAAADWMPPVYGFACLAMVLGGMALRLQEAAPAHQAVNRRLIAVVGIAGFALVQLVIGLGDMSPLPLAVGIGLLALALRYLLAIAPMVPDTHQAFRAAGVLSKEKVRRRVSLALELVMLSGGYWAIERLVKMTMGE